MQSSEYKYGFKTDVKSERQFKGLSEKTVMGLSQKKSEPMEMTDIRLKALETVKKMKLPRWAEIDYPEDLKLDELYYYAAPKKEQEKEALDTYKKLGVDLDQDKVAVDAIFDSVSLKTTFRDKLEKAGVIFCSIGDALKDHKDLVLKHFGSVVPMTDNYFACLNTAVFSDGTFVYVPKNTKCPLELSTYFRINENKTGQFERTLIIADEGSELSYLEGCTAVQRDENQLHAAVVEIIVKKGAKVKYSTVQNWYPGDKEGKGGIFNFVTKRGLCEDDALLTWTQVETGSALTWKYPSCILKGDRSRGEFYSAAITNHKQEADTGTKMIHLGKDTTSYILSKGIAFGESKNTYRGLVKIGKNATGAKNTTRCDSLIYGNKAAALTYPVQEIGNAQSVSEHEATTSSLSEERLFYLSQRGFPLKEAEQMIVSGFCQDVLSNLPFEFAAEAKQLLSEVLK